MLCHVNLKVNREFIFMQACMYGFFVQGQHLGTTEATEAFFAMTKLFQSKDVSWSRCFRFFSLRK